MIFADFGEPMMSTPGLRRGRHARFTPAIPHHFGAVDINSTNTPPQGSATTPPGGGVYTAPPPSTTVPTTYKSTLFLSTQQLAPASSLSTSTPPRIMTAPPLPPLAPSSEPTQPSMPQTSFPVSSLTPVGTAITNAANAAGLDLVPAGGVTQQRKYTSLYILGGVFGVAALVGGIILAKSR